MTIPVLIFRSWVTSNGGKMIKSEESLNTGEISQTGALPPKIASTPARVVGWIGGSALGFYFGLAMFLPIFGIGIIFWLFSKLVNEPRRKLFGPAFSVIAYQLLGQGALVIYIGDAMGFPLVDIVMVVLSGVGLTWFMLNPRHVALTVLGIVQLTRIVLGAIGAVTSVLSEAIVTTGDLAMFAPSVKSIILNVVVSAVGLYFLIRTQRELKARAGVET